MDPHLLAGLGAPKGRGELRDQPPPARANQPRGQVEYAYSGAPNPRRATLDGMLWSDPENEPPKELREAQQMLRRLGFLMALAMLLAMIVLGVL